VWSLPLDSSSRHPFFSILLALKDVILRAELLSGPKDLNFMLSTPNRVKPHHR